jgi:hypothetical protein
MMPGLGWRDIGIDLFAISAEMADSALGWANRKPVLTTASSLTLPSPLDAQPHIGLRLSITTHATFLVDAVVF